MSKMWLVLISVLGLVFFTSCGYLVDEKAVVAAVEKQGYRQVTITRGHRLVPFLTGCGTEDEAAFELKAVNPLDNDVELMACAGWPFKGVTIRTK